MLHVWTLSIYKLIYVSNYSLCEDKTSSEGGDSEAQGTIECVGMYVPTSWMVALTSARLIHPTAIPYVPRHAVALVMIQCKLQTVLKSTKPKRGRVKNFDHSIRNGTKLTPGLFYAPPYLKRIAHGVDTVKEEGLNTEKGR